MRHLMKIIVLALFLTGTASAAPGKYAEVNGLKMYYEVHGKGRPLVLIHGAFCTIDECFDRLVKEYAKTRQVIVMELQGHGRTGDIDRPLSTVKMADDVAALLGKLKVPSADVYGYSMGGGVAVQLAIRHPALVKKLVIAGAALTKDGAQPGSIEMIKSIKPEMMEQGPWFEAYKKLSPHPTKFRELLKKVQGLDTLDGFKAEDIKKIKAPVMMLMGDADFPTVEHGAQVLRMFGGGAFGDTGQPRATAQLAILPGTSHVDLIHRSEWIVAMTTPFFGK
jgi:pimeloyl-ACP methyl ester carboxylesterase